MNDKVILTILDGFGYTDRFQGNAVAQAETPNIDALLENYPHVLIRTSGESVGLPDGLMGNSEVGHLNIGAGRIVYQEITRIDKAVEEGEFFQNDALVSLLKRIPPENAIHIMGLVSDGGVHSSMDHLKALLKMTKRFGRKNVFLHAFTDGRDTPPHSGIKYIREMQAFMIEENAGEIATVSGRYFAMDRDKRWERIKRAYDALVFGQGMEFDSPEAAVNDSYRRAVTDEFIIPSVIKRDGKPVGPIRKGDGAVFFNFRSDRTRQLTRALAVQDFDGFERDFLNLDLVTMTEYEDDFHLPIAFSHESMENILGAVVSRKNWKQLRIAETEKYAHVTFFFNGGDENPFPGEERILIPSPKVATYDLKPEMSAFQVADKVVNALNSREFKLIVLNFANCDMVGHTGVFDAAKRAVETVDTCVGKVYDAAMMNAYSMILTADHGNAEQMIADDSEPYTAHTTNPVHFIYIDPDRKPKLRTDGALCNIAPTILEILGLEKPPQMVSSMTAC
ncbi:MAG: 2,3-bisphosphoglycerate-independent phosphoglycerate mutase [candidate division Zixibacteria bacterium]|nr:2,3-bisphosphoglycerate-independent phosphoglycerate mutase [Candidatus Tariuqbacter arcticus]